MEGCFDGCIEEVSMVTSMVTQKYFHRNGDSAEVAWLEFLFSTSMSSTFTFAKVYFSSVLSLESHSSLEQSI